MSGTKKKLKIHSEILSKIGWVESSLKIHKKPLYKSENFGISDKISLNMAINEDCSKIGVVGLINHKGKDKINLFEKSNNNIDTTYAYKVKGNVDLKPIAQKNFPFKFVNLVFTTKNSPLWYTWALQRKNAFDGLTVANGWIEPIDDDGTKHAQLTFNKAKKLMACTWTYKECLIKNVVTNETTVEIGVPFMKVDPYHKKLRDLNINSCFDKHGNKIAIPCYTWKNSYYGLSIYTIASKKLVNIKCAPYRIRCLALSNDGTLVAAQIEDQKNKKYKTCLWNAETAQLLREISGASPLIQIMFTPQDNWLMTVPEKGAINLINIFTKKTIATKLAPFTKKSAIPCSSCVSLQEDGNDVLLYGIFQNEENDKKCNLELYRIESAAQSDDFFLGLYMKQNNIKQFNKNTLLYPELKPIYDQATPEFKQSKQIMKPDWSSWIKEKASKYWPYVAVPTVTGLGLYLGYKMMDGIEAITKSWSITSIKNRTSD